MFDDFDITPADLAAMGFASVEAYRIYQQQQRQRYYTRYPYSYPQSGNTSILLLLGLFLLVSKS